MARLEDFDRRLPCGKRLSALGLGCSSWWAKPGFAEDKALGLLEIAHDRGINHFDTGPSYGQGEERLGRFLAGRDRTDFVISTKVGTERGGARSFDPLRMRRSLKHSLARIGLETVDILYLHGPSRDQIGPATWRFFDDAKRDGLIRHAGINSFDPEVLDACIAAPLEMAMVQYSLADQRLAPQVDALAQAGKMVIAATIMGQGQAHPHRLLKPDRAGLWYLARALRKDPLFFWHGRILRRRTAALGMAGHAASIRFTLSDRRISSGIFGTTSLAHLVQNIEAADRMLDETQMAAVGMAP